MDRNKVVSEFTAIIDGKWTGLAGCKRKCDGCIRGDDKLQKTVDFGRNNEVCQRFISY